MLSLPVYGCTHISHPLHNQVKRHDLEQISHVITGEIQETCLLVKNGNIVH